MENRRIIIVLASPQDHTATSDNLCEELSSLGLDNIRRSDDSGLPVVTCTVPAQADIPRLLETLNGMPAIRNAEEDSWTFNQ